MGSRLAGEWGEAGLVTGGTRARILPLPLCHVSSGKPRTSLSFYHQVPFHPSSPPPEAQPGSQGSGSGARQGLRPDTL